MEKTGSNSIFIGAGANLAHPVHGSPRQTLEAAFGALEGRGIHIARVSPWYRSAPVPASDQPWYVNAVAEVAADLPADRLLAELHAVE
ncbi:MAG: 2-amino-4-hydroxy-6-hydroxymethyldihydropteridine diphosphokinase, partial [Reyranellales bacterium]